MRLRFLLPVVPICLLLAALPGIAFSQPAKEMPEISTELSFHCLWWSGAQMEGLNPNAPPPRSTDVKIEKWEYSDPIGVPNPDIVDLVISLRNLGRVPAEKLRLRISAAWQVGPQSNRKRAAWQAGSILQKFDSLDLAAGESKTLRVPVNLAEKMNMLQKRRLWPWTLRLQVSAFSATGRLLSKNKADLPIFPGD